MREPTLATVLDDCAAVGDVAKLERLEERARKHLEERARKHTGDRPGLIVCTPRSVMWAHAADACYFRRKAIEHRLDGDVHKALVSERHSERSVKYLGAFGKERSRA